MTGDFYEEDEDPKSIYEKFEAGEKGVTARPTHAANFEFWFKYQDDAVAESVFERVADIVMDTPGVSGSFMCGTLRAAQEKVDGAKARIDGVAKILLTHLPATYNSQVVAKAYETAEEIVGLLRSMDIQDDQ